MDEFSPEPSSDEESEKMARNRIAAILADAMDVDVTTTKAGHRQVRVHFRARGTTCTTVYVDGNLHSTERPASARPGEFHAIHGYPADADLVQRWNRLAALAGLDPEDPRSLDRFSEAYSGEALHDRIARHLHRREG